MIIIKGYTLVYEPKYKRALETELGAGPNATEEQILAFYDKFGGLILKDGQKVENGKFWAEYQAKLALANREAIEKAKKETQKEKDVEIAKDVEVKKTKKTKK